MPTTEQNYSTIVFSPLEQFEVRNLLSLDAPILGDINLSMTNIGLYLTIGALIVLTLNILATNYNKLGSNNWSISNESLYATLHSIVVNQINETRGQIYFPFLYSLFIFILINNLIGMVEVSPTIILIDNIFTLSSLLISNKKLKGNYYSVNCKYSTSSSSNNNSKGILLNPYYLTGFIDAEGCFNLTLYKNSQLATGWHVLPTFKISLHTKDRALLESIQRSLGVGSISKHGKNSIQLRINGLNNLSVVIKHLDSYPLITKKFSDSPARFFEPRGGL